MNLRYTCLALAAAGAALVGGGIAHAGVIASGSVGGAPSGATLENFDTVPLGAASYTTPSGLKLVFVTDAGGFVGAVNTIAAQPYLSGNNGNGFGAGGGNQPNGPDTTTYLTSGSDGLHPGSSVTMTLPSQMTYFGLLWGSIDTYNTLSFYNGANLVATFTGADILAGADGNQGASGTQYVNFDATGGTTFDTVIASASGYAFEFDNAAFGASPLPEPVSIVLLATGLAGVGFVRRRRS